MTTTFYRIGDCLQERDDVALTLTTVMPDGARLVACPVPERDAPMAALVGCTVEELCFSHDMAHCLVCEALGKGYSPVLFNATHNLLQPLDVFGFEEATVLAFQAFVWTGVRSDDLRVLAWFGVDLDAMRQRALHLLGGAS